MPTTTQLDVDKLQLDLKNFRTLPQKKEKDAIKAMIAIKPERFYGILESILDDGYLPTENIIVYKTKELAHEVREGNRRIAALKLIHGNYKLTDFNLPTSVVNKIKTIDDRWKKENLKVPCTVFSANELDKVERVVSLTHGKGEKAARDKWTSVATARHNRDVNGAAEHSLSLLELYIKKGQNINNQQKDRWAGDFPLTVLEEALRRIHSRLGFDHTVDLVKKYPNISKRNEFEEILLKIGLEEIKWETLRNKDLDFGAKYGIPPLPTAAPTPPASPTSANPASPGTSGATFGSDGTTGATPPNSGSTTGLATGGTATPGSAPSTTGPSVTAPGSSAATPPPPAYATTDPRHVQALMKKFAPKGANRQKVVTLANEIRNLKIANNPIAFCFLLRSMFEISAKIYCSQHTLPIIKSGGKDKTLKELLITVKDHLTNNNSNTPMSRTLHGAATELSKPDGLLSVTSLNQLVHHPSFSISTSDICTVFGNVYPLLESMN